LTQLHRITESLYRTAFERTRKEARLAASPN
jgi:hypothetical protein